MIFVGCYVIVAATARNGNALRGFWAEFCHFFAVRTADWGRFRSRDGGRAQIPLPLRAEPRKAGRGTRRVKRVLQERRVMLTVILGFVIRPPESPFRPCAPLKRVFHVAAQTSSSSVACLSGLHRFRARIACAGGAEGADRPGDHRSRARRDNPRRACCCHHAGGRDLGPRDPCTRDPCTRGHRAGRDDCWRCRPRRDNACARTGRFGVQRA